MCKSPRRLSTGFFNVVVFVSRKIKSKGEIFMENNGNFAKNMERLMAELDESGWENTLASCFVFDGFGQTSCGGCPYEDTPHAKPVGDEVCLVHLGNATATLLSWLGEHETIESAMEEATELAQKASKEFEKGVIIL